jgi:hypothetical protein
MACGSMKASLDGCLGMLAIAFKPCGSFGTAILIPAFEVHLNWMGLWSSLPEEAPVTRADQIDHNLMIYRTKQGSAVIPDDISVSRRGGIHGRR